MKKFLVMTMMLLTGACASGPIFGDEDCEYKRTPRKISRIQQIQPTPVIQPKVIPCYIAQPVTIQRPQPKPQPVTCDGCEPTVKEVREPVEIVYKKVIYTTTYEPKTTQSVVYEREPIKNVEVKKVKVQHPTIKEVIVEQPAQTVSETIENQVSQEPEKILIEEVK